MFVYGPTGLLAASVRYAAQKPGFSVNWDTQGKPLGFSAENVNGAWLSSDSTPDVGSPGYAVAGHSGALTCKVYWTDKNAGKIQRGDRDGGSVEDILTMADGLIEPRGLAVDMIQKKMVWVDGALGTIQQADLDGSRQEVLVSGLDLPRDLALDVHTGKMYWTDRGTRAIQRANRDGTGPIEDIVRNVGEPYYLALDLIRGRIYWSDFQNTYIRRVDLDGRGPVEDVVDHLDFVRDIVVDPNGQRIYWGDRGSHLVQRTRLDGTGTVETLFGPKGLDRPHGLFLDTRTGQLYWTDTQADAVFRGPAAGQAPYAYLATGLDGPWALTLIQPDPDLNGDRVVNGLDFCLWAGYWGLNDPNSLNIVDLNADGKLNYSDLQYLTGMWLSNVNE